MSVQFLRFAGVGGLATLTHFLCALVAHELFGLDDLFSNFMGFCVAVLVSYFGHSRFTFAVDAKNERFFPRFLLVSVTGLCVSSFIVWLVSSWAGQSFLVAMILVVLIVPVATYTALRFWVFTHRDSPLVPSWLMIVTTVVAMFLFLAAYWNWPVNHDTAWYLVATRKMLGGARLYVDLIEVNPPLNFYLTIPALLIADFLRVSDTNAQYMAVAVLYGLSLLWTGAILRQKVDVPATRKLLFFGFIALVYILAAVSDIAQREHFLVLFLSPWLMGHLVDHNKSRAVPRAVFAAIGICIKPFFIFYPLFFLFADMWRARSVNPILWPSYLAMLAIGFSYVVFVYFVHPEYLFDIVPVASDVYGAYKKPLTMIAASLYGIMLVCFAAFVPALLTGSDNSWVYPLAALAAFTSFLVQSTGFGYHLVPLISYALLAGGWLIITCNAITVKHVVSYLACAVILVGLFSVGKYRNSVTYEVVRVAQDIGPINSLFATSTVLAPGSPAALRLGIEWDSRYPTNWLYPGAIAALDRANCEVEIDLCTRLEAIIQRNIRDNLEDILHRKPDLLVTDHFTQPTAINPVSWISLAKLDPQYAEVMENYTLVKSTRRMEYFLRNEDAR